MTTTTTLLFETNSHGTFSNYFNFEDDKDSSCVMGVAVLTKKVPGFKLKQNGGTSAKEARDHDHDHDAVEDRDESIVRLFVTYE